MMEWVVNHYEEVTTITESRGNYRLEIKYYANYASVKVEDKTSFRFPLVFAMTMTYEQANSYLELFKTCGYVEVA